MAALKCKELECLWMMIGSPYFTVAWHIPQKSRCGKSPAFGRVAPPDRAGHLPYRRISRSFQFSRALHADKCRGFSYLGLCQPIMIEAPKVST